jgi:hypothetical protein
MSSIFGRLNFAGGDYIEPLANTTIKHMDTMPPLLDDWQKQDLADNNVSGYLKNPVSSQIGLLSNDALAINVIPYIAQTNASIVLAAADTLRQTCVTFSAHVDRIAGVVDITTNTVTLPHYNTAVGIGKIMMYITNQSDGVENNAPIMGSFSSLYTADELTTYHTTIQGYSTTISNNMYSFLNLFCVDLPSKSVSPPNSSIIS